MVIFSQLTRFNGTSVLSRGGSVDMETENSLLRPGNVNVLGLMQDINLNHMFFLVLIESNQKYGILVILCYKAIRRLELGEIRVLSMSTVDILLIASERVFQNSPKNFSRGQISHEP